MDRPKQRGWPLWYWEFTCGREPQSSVIVKLKVFVRNITMFKTHLSKVSNKFKRELLYALNFPKSIWFSAKFLQKANREILELNLKPSDMFPRGGRRDEVPAAWGDHDRTYPREQGLAALRGGNVVHLASDVRDWSPGRSWESKQVLRGEEKYNNEGTAVSSRLRTSLKTQLAE